MRDLKTGLVYGRLQKDRNKNVVLHWGKTHETGINHGRKQKENKTEFKKYRVSDRHEWHMWGGLPHWHTAVYVYVTAASAFSSASFKSVMYPLPFLAASHLSTHLSTHSSLANKKEKGSHGLDYDANRQMRVEQGNLKQDSFPFTFSCWPCWKSAQIPWIHEGINMLTYAWKTTHP